MTSCCSVRNSFCLVSPTGLLWETLVLLLPHKRAWRLNVYAVLISVLLISSSTAFLFYRGRAFVYLGNTEVQCRQISFSSSIFLVNKPTHVLLAVNYFNSSGKYTHEAAVAWTEDVSSTKFRICVLTAGRLDRVPPDGGLTYVDFIAYQGNPVGSVTGHENLTSWWDGTSCKEVSLPQVYSTQYHQAAFITRLDLLPTGMSKCPCRKWSKFLLFTWVITKEFFMTICFTLFT